MVSGPFIGILFVNMNCMQSVGHALPATILSVLRQGLLLIPLLYLLDGLFGLDGVILLAFVLAFPANELVMPLIVMGYLATGTIADVSDFAAFRTLLVANGWTVCTALCTLVFTVAHWPCSTTCLTIWKETHSVRWTLAAVALPTAFGLALCLAVHGACTLIGLA